MRIGCFILKPINALVVGSGNFENARTHACMGQKI
jgi:hypothetical protein